jgi:hypothetical protein
MCSPVSLMRMMMQRSAVLPISYGEYVFHVSLFFSFVINHNTENEAVLSSMLAVSVSNRLRCCEIHDPQLQSSTPLHVSFLAARHGKR